MTAKLMEENELLFMEGEPGNEMYILKSGTLSILKREGSQMVSLAKMGPGSVIGEMSLLDNAPRSATVRSLETCELVSIDQKLLAATYKKLPSWLTSLIKILVQRLRNTNIRKHQNDILHCIPLLLRTLVLIDKNVFPAPIHAQEGIPFVLLERELQYQYGLQPKDSVHLLHLLADLGLFTIEKVKRIGNVVLLQGTEILEQYQHIIKCHYQEKATFVETLTLPHWKIYQNIKENITNKKPETNGIIYITLQSLSQLESPQDSEINQEFVDLLEQEGYLVTKAKFPHSSHGSNANPSIAINQEKFLSLERFKQRLPLFKKDLREFI